MEWHRIEVIWEQMNLRLWSRGRLAEVAGLSRSTLDPWPERGPVRAHRRTFEKIVGAFDRHPVPSLVARGMAADDA